MTQTAHGVEFTQHLSETPKSAEERAAILANPGFGDYFTDHTAIVDYSVDAAGNGGNAGDAEQLAIGGEGIHETVIQVARERCREHEQDRVRRADFR